MDRRDALKKMAATGVIVSGASAIVSSTAFADGGTPNSLPNTGGGGTISFTGTPHKNRGRVTVGLSFSLGTVPTGSCPDPTVPPTREYRYDGSISSSGWLQSLPGSSVNLGTVSTATVTVTVRWICGGDWKCESYVATVSTRQAGPNGTVVINGRSSGSSLTVPVTSAGSGTFCDTNPPS